MTPPGSRCPAAPRRLQTGEGRRWPLRRGPRARPGERLPGHGGGGRGGSAVEAASPGAGRPRHHHRLGGSSATLLLNKVISSRCTMGTSRMTSVRPSWSRGKMTTLSAGRSAWKLNQRRSRQQAGGAPPPAVGPGVSPTPRLMQKPPRGLAGVLQTEGALLLWGRGGGPAGCRAEGGGRGRPAGSAAGKQPVGTAPVWLWGAAGDTQGPAEPRTVPTEGGEKGQGRTHRPQATLEGCEHPVRRGSNSARPEKPGGHREPGATV